MSALPSQRDQEVEKRKLLVTLLARHQRQLLGYIHTLVPRLQDAEDIFQETCEVICEKFDTFSPGTDFLAWACEISRWRVRAARTTFARSKITFSDEVVEQLSRTIADLTGFTWRLCCFPGWHGEPFSSCPFVAARTSAVGRTCRPLRTAAGLVTRHGR